MLLKGTKFVLIFASISALFVSVKAVSEPSHATLSLNCFGKDISARRPVAYRVKYYIDLTIGTYCRDDCKWLKKIKFSDSDVIDLSWPTYSRDLSPESDEIELYGSNGKTVFYRKTGQFSSSEIYNGSSLIRREIKGKFSVEPIKFYPTEKFLANAQDQ